MKKLKLIKPWQLPTVRMTLCDNSFSSPIRDTPAAQAAPCNAPIREEGRGSMMIRVAAHAAPACSVIFASAANQQLGCPRQSI